MILVAEPEPLADRLERLRALIPARRPRPSTRELAGQILAALPAESAAATALHRQLHDPDVLCVRLLAEAILATLPQDPPELVAERRAILLDRRRAE